tara:strand:- start:2352 stop:3266 length:915 start_codon:yes stop_codon:yes gene_type:complete
MIDISDKNTSLRESEALAIVKVSTLDTISIIKENKVPKGNLFEVSKTAGLLGIKNTHLLLPNCHPIPIENAKIEFEINDLEIKIFCKIKTIYKTGVEVEAMHGASVVALNIYDMLKPIDENVEILSIKLISKKGGKSDYKLNINNINASIIVCSDSVSLKKNIDKSGEKIIELLTNWKINILKKEIISDDKLLIQKTINDLISNNNIIIITGGTGLSKRDVTPEAVIPLLHKRIPGIEEKIRSYGQQKTHFSMLSRSVAGLIDECLILCLPGSVKGVEDSILSIFPWVLHSFEILKNIPHEKNQ